MAEFGISATQLSAPQGAGANPIAPVQEAYVPSIGVSIFKQVAETFMDGLDKGAKQSAERAKNAAIGQYSAEIGKWVDEYANGNLSNSELSARTQAIHRQFISNPQFAQYTPEFDQIRNSYKGGSELGKATSELEDEQKLFQKQVEQAVANGAYIPKGADPELIKAAVEHDQTVTRISKERERIIRDNVENRAATKFDQDVQDRQLKEFSGSALNTIATTKLKSFAALGANFAKQVKAGSMSFEDAKAAYTMEFSKIQSFILSTGKDDPSLMAPYMSMFQNNLDVYIQNMNPESDAKQSGARLDAVMNATKLALIEKNPKAKQVLALSQMAGANGTLALSISQILPDLISETTNPTKVVGTEYEKPTIEFAKGALNKLETGEYPDKEAAMKEGRIVIDNLVGQAYKHINQEGSQAKDFTPTMGFLASTAFGSAAKSGVASDKALSNAAEIIKVGYEKDIVQGVVKKLQQTFNTRPTYDQSFSPKNGANKGNTRNVSELVKVSFAGSTVSFVPVNGSEAESPLVKSTIKQLEPSGRALTELVRAMTHVSRSVDYQKYWDEVGVKLMSGEGVPPEVKRVLNMSPEQQPVATESQMKSAAKIKPEEIIGSKASVEEDIRNLKAALGTKGLPENIKRDLEAELKKLGG